MLKSIERNGRTTGALRTRGWLPLLLGCVLLCAAPAMAERGKVTAASGAAEIGRGTPPAFESAKPGDSVDAGDVIRTGRGGRVELVLGAGTVRLYENSLLRIPADTRLGHQVEMERGRSIFDVIKESVTDRFEVRTPEVVVSVKGTRFEVDLAGDLAEVAVFRGTVGVRAPEASLELETLVREGFAAMGGADVPFELDLSPRNDPWDSWATLNEVRETAMRTERSERQAQLQIAAQASARRSSAKELVGLASERNPQVARKVEQMRRERLEARAEKPNDTKQGPPASPSPTRDVMNGNRGKGSGGKLEFRRNQMELDMDAKELVERIDEDRQKYKQMAFMQEDPTGTGSLDLPEDPGGSAGTGGGWDPTPQLSMLEVAELGVPLSFEDLVTIWYGIVQDLQVSDPTVFQQAGPDDYEDALQMKFEEIGMPSNMANNIADYIVDLIEDQQ